MYQLLSDPNVWAAFVTLTILEIVLGVDNVIFISIAAAKLPPEQRRQGRTIGLVGALVLRILLLFSITWIIGLSEPIFELGGYAMSWRDLILIAGGLFLIYKAVTEIFDEVEGAQEAETGGAVYGNDVRGHRADHGSGSCLLDRQRDHRRRHCR